MIHNKRESIADKKSYLLLVQNHYKIIL